MYTTPPGTRNLLTVFTLFLLLLPPAIRAEVIDQIVAVVNNDVITMSELEKETREQYRAAVRNGGGNDVMTTMEVIREKTLNSIIDRKLLEQKAQEMNVQVSDEEIDRIFDNNVSRSGASRELFLEEMHKAGFSEKSYRQNLRASLLQGKLINLDVRSKIVVTEEMIEKRYREKYISKVDGKVYNLLQMGFVWGTDSEGRTRSRANALELAKRIRADVLVGKDFRELAQKYSDLPSAPDGGDIGSFTIDEMAEEMADVVRDLRPSEVSTIIETPDGYQFFQLVSYEKDAVIVKDSLENTREDIREELYQEKLRSSYENWIKTLKENAYIKKLH